MCTFHIHFYHFIDIWSNRKSFCKLITEKVVNTLKIRFSYLSSLKIINATLI